MNAKRAEVIVCHPQSAQLLRFESLQHGRPGAVQSQFLKTLALCPPVHIGGITHVAWFPSIVLAPDNREPAGLTIGQRAQENSVYETEDRGVGADAYRQRQHRHHREAGIFQEHPTSKSQVLEQGFKKGKPALGPIVFLSLFNAPQLHERLPPRFGSAHARAQIVLDVHLEMALHLCGELPLTTLLSK